MNAAHVSYETNPRAEAVARMLAPSHYPSVARLAIDDDFDWEFSLFRIRYCALARQKRREALAEVEARKVTPQKTRDYKNWCRSQASAARDRGEIPYDDCAMCRSPAHHMHHVDYCRPLVVIWLCRACHVQIHNMLRAEQRNYSKINRGAARTRKRMAHARKGKEC